MTLSDYATRNDGKVFDGEAVAKLYDKIISAYNVQNGGQAVSGVGTYQKAYNAVKNSSSTITGSGRTGSGYNFASDWTQPNAMDYAAISQGTAGSVGTKTSAPDPVVVEFGGYSWSVVYLTTNTTGSNGSGDLIATLWMNDTLKGSNGSAVSVPYGAFGGSAAASDTYFGSSYSTSRIRVRTMNAAGTHNVNYATSNSARDGVVSQTDRENNVLAAFTMDSGAIGAKSLTAFLETPKNVKYQEKENAVWASLKRTQTVYLLPNEAWGSPDTVHQNDGGGHGWTAATSNGVIGSFGNTSAPVYSTYLEWTNDYIWLPSLTELGYTSNDGSSEKGTSLWGIPTGHDIFTGSGYQWTRSGTHHNSEQMMSISPNGRIIRTMNSCEGYSANNYVRPALHLNLTAVQRSLEADGSATVPQPQDITLTYDAKNHFGVTTTMPDWVDASLHGNTGVVQVKEIKYNNTTVIDPADYTTKIKDAGTYKVTLKIADAAYAGSGGGYVWRNGTGQEASFTITINKKKLPVLSITDGDSDGVPDTFTYDTSQLCTGDTLAASALSVKYGASNVTDAASATDTPPTAAGQYNAIAVITDTNYEVDTSGTNHYKAFQLKGGVAKPYFAAEAAGTIATTAKYTGTALEFQLAGVTSGVTVTAAGSGITYNAADKKLVVSGGVGTHTATVKLADKTNTQWAGGGDADYTLTVTVTKGTYDFSGVKWQYKDGGGNWVDYPATGVEYTGSAIELRATDLPNGLIAGSYTDNSKTDADSYTAKLNSFTNADTTNFDTVNTSTVPQLQCAWQINKKQVSLSGANAWYQKNETITGSADPLPVWTLPANAAYEVVYYAQDDFDFTSQGPKPGVQALQVSDLTYSQTSTKTYVAYARLASGTVYQKNYELTGTLYQQFTIGGSKTGVTVTVTGTSKTYDGTPFAITATVADGSGTPLPVQLTYEWRKADATGNAPGDVIAAADAVDAGTYYLYIDVDGADAGYYHIDSIVGGTPYGAGVIRVEITKKAVDLSGLVWNYDPTNPYVYARDENGAVEHSVMPTLPTDLPQALIDAIGTAYSGATNTEAGTHRATANLATVLGANADIQKNYDLTYPTGLSPLDWTVEALDLGVPTYDGSWTVFDGLESGHDLAAACGLPADWAMYLDLTVTYTAPDGTQSTYAGYKGDVHIGFDAGTYDLHFSVKNDVNATGADPNVWLDDDVEADATATVAPRAVTVTGWRGKGTAAQPEFAESGVLSDWYTQAVYDAAGQPAEPGDGGKYAPGTYSRTIVPTSQNVTITFTDGQEFVLFSVNEQGGETDAEKTKVTRPTYKAGSATYSGESVTITDENAAQYLDGFDPETMTVTACDEGTDAGAYAVTVALKNPSLTTWEDETSDPAAIDWAIGKAKIPQAWINPKDPTMSGSEFGDSVAFEYTYYDTDGKEVAREDLKAGEKYTVKAKLKEGYDKNFEFIDADGNVLTVPAESEPYAFVKGSDTWLGQLCEKLGLSPNFPLWQVAVTAVCLLLFILFLLLWILGGKKKKRAEKTIKEYKTIGLFLPAAFLDVPFLTLENKIWTIIACVSIGLMLIAFIGMLAIRGKAKAKAEEAEKLSSDPILRMELEKKKRAVAEQLEEEKRKEEERKAEEKRKAEAEAEAAKAAAAPVAPVQPVPMQPAMPGTVPVAQPQAAMPGGVPVMQQQMPGSVPVMPQQMQQPQSVAPAMPQGLPGQVATVENALPTGQPIPAPQATPNRPNIDLGEIINAGFAAGIAAGQKTPPRPTPARPSAVPPAARPGLNGATPVPPRPVPGQTGNLPRPGVTPARPVPPPVRPGIPPRPTPTAPVNRPMPSSAGARPVPGQTGIRPTTPPVKPAGAAPVRPLPPKPPQK